MNSNYDLSDYTSDVLGAYAKYTSVIRDFCEFDGAPVPLNDEMLYQAKSQGRAYKNQILSAAGKRLRAGVALRMLDSLQQQFDLTSTLAFKITKHLLGRSIDRKVLLERYGTRSRTAAHKSSDFKSMENIIQSVAFVEAEKELAMLLDSAQEIRGRIGREQLKAGQAAKILARSNIRAATF